MLRLVHTLSVLGIEWRSAGPTRPLRDLFDAAGVTVSVGLIGLVVDGATGPARILLAVAFAFFVPGRAIVTNWPRFAYWSEFGISIVLSLALLALVATVTLWAHEWHPVGLLEIEAPLSVAALVVGTIRRHRGPQTERYRSRAVSVEPAKPQEQPAKPEEQPAVAADAEMGPVEASFVARAQPSPQGDDW